MVCVATSVRQLVQNRVLVQSTVPRQLHVELICTSRYLATIQLSARQRVLNVELGLVVLAQGLVDWRVHHVVEERHCVTLRDALLYNGIALLKHMLCRIHLATACISRVRLATGLLHLFLFCYIVLVFSTQFTRQHANVIACLAWRRSGLGWCRSWRGWRDGSYWRRYWRLNWWRLLEVLSSSRSSYRAPFLESSPSSTRKSILEPSHHLLGPSIRG